MESSIASFFRNGYCSVLLRSDIDDLIRAAVSDFERFITEPPQFKDAWTFDLDGDGENDDGYVRKNGGQDDEKHYIHYRPHLPDLLKERRADIGTYETFLALLQDLYEQALLGGILFFQKLDQHPEARGIRKRFHSAARKQVLRLLIYDSAPNGHLIGKRHTDKSAVTFHLLDSHPGLMLNEIETPYQCVSKTALAFTGDKLERFTKGRIKATEHGIVSVTNENIRRWSSVFFMHI